MTIHIPLLYLNFLISTALPALTAFLAHQAASARVKTLILAGLSVVAGIANALIQSGGSVTFTQAGIWTLISFTIAAVMHSGLLKPLGLTGSGGLIMTKFPGGLGAPRTRPGHAKDNPTSLA
jgi:hypothetical protein